MRTVVAARLRKARSRSTALGNTENPSLAGKAKRSTTLGRELRTCTSLLGHCWVVEKHLNLTARLSQGKPKIWN